MGAATENASVLDTNVRKRREKCGRGTEDEGERHWGECMCGGYGCKWVSGTAAVRQWLSKEQPIKVEHSGLRWQLKSYGLTRRCKQQENWPKSGCRKKKTRDEAC